MQINGRPVASEQGSSLWKTMFSLNNATHFECSLLLFSVAERILISGDFFFNSFICFSEKNKINSRILQSNELILEEAKSQHKDVIKKLISNEILSDKNANSIDVETLYLKESPFPLKTTETSIKEKIRKLILS